MVSFIKKLLTQIIKNMLVENLLQIYKTFDYSPIYPCALLLFYFYYNHNTFSAL